MTSSGGMKNYMGSCCTLYSLSAPKLISLLTCSLVSFPCGPAKNGALWMKHENLIFFSSQWVLLSICPPYHCVYYTMVRMLQWFLCVPEVNGFQAAFSFPAPLAMMLCYSNMWGVGWYVCKAQSCGTDGQQIVNVKSCCFFLSFSCELTTNLKVSFCPAVEVDSRCLDDFSSFSILGQCFTA